MARQCYKTWKTFSNVLVFNKQLSHQFVISRLLSNSHATTSKLNSVWNIYGSLYIQRPAIINRDLTPLEKEYSQLLSVIEYEKSLLNDHELRHKNDLKQKNQKDLVDDAEGVALQTAQDIEDIWQAGFETFVPASRDTTGKGQNNEDLHSLKRLQDRNLILVVKSKTFGDWRLPSCLYQPGETIRQTAERVMPELFGSNLKAQIIGNAPIGVYNFEYSRKIDRKTVPNEADGGKVFFLPAYYTNGDVQIDPKSSDVIDFAWLCTEEVWNLFKVNRAYLTAIKRFHLEETFTYAPSAIYRNKLAKRQQIKQKMAAS